MKSIVEARLTITWLVLSLLTISYLLLTSHDESTLVTASTSVTISAIIISLFKVRLILREFMEIRHASTLLHRITDAWILCQAVVLISLYLLGMNNMFGVN